MDIFNTNSYKFQVTTPLTSLSDDNSKHIIRFVQDYDMLANVSKVSNNFHAKTNEILKVSNFAIPPNVLEIVHKLMKIAQESLRNCLK